ncbi:MAG: ASPIC/UnbV domain-containing protein [Saprospiraceae bacterium]|nr:ASPIC/UnbV domain-containing protein [Saprospiraceae bacterium]
MSSFFFFCSSRSKNVVLQLKLSNKSHFINKLKILLSNKSAIGAANKVKSNGLWQSDKYCFVQGIGSQKGTRQHFGLGTSTTIDSIDKMAIRVIYTGN